MKTIFKKNKEPDTATYPRLFRNAALTLTKQDGEIIGHVRLSEFSPRTLKLARLPGEIIVPQAEKDSTVNVHGYGDDGENFVLTGTVTNVTRQYIIVENIILMEAANKRRSPRVIVNRPAEIFDAAGKLKDKPIECTLYDISTGGAKIITGVEYGIGKEIRLRVELYEKAGTISFKGQIIRTKELNAGKYEYGIIFEELTNEKRRYLVDDMKAVRTREQERASK